MNFDCYKYSFNLVRDFAYSPYHFFDVACTKVYQILIYKSILPITSYSYDTVNDDFFTLISYVQSLFMLFINLFLGKLQNRNCGQVLIPCHFSKLQLRRFLVSLCPLSVREYCRCIIQNKWSGKICFRFEIILSQKQYFKEYLPVNNPSKKYFVVILDILQYRDLLKRCKMFII